MAPPPPPRRHSHPATNAPYIITQDRETCSHQSKRQSKLDLRQELLNSTVSTHDFDRWLGTKCELYEDRFKHDIPLKRSISLDGGLAITNYLQNIGSDWSGSSIASSWTINSDGESLIGQYRSCEDISASQFMMKSRRASSDFGSVIGNNLALSVLRSSYKGIDVESGSVSPHLKRLRNTFSFSSSFDISRTEKSEVITLREEEQRSQTDSDPQDEPELEITSPYYRSISIEASGVKMSEDIDTSKPRQRRPGISRNLSFQGIKKLDDDLRKMVLMKQNSCKFGSTEDVPPKPLRRGSGDAYMATQSALTLLKDSYKGIGNGNIMKLKRTFSFRGSVERIDRGKPITPTIVISKPESDSSVAKQENLVFKNTSNLVGFSRNCDCQICMEEEREEKRSLLSRFLRTLFMKIVSCRDFGRRLTWDENNNSLKENEMYNSFVHILKLMLGLWLRHLDHN